MIIIPYIYKRIERGNLTFNKYKILCQGGKDVWTETDDNDIVDDILEPNEIYAARTVEDNGVYYVEVNTEKTNICNMYNWNEISYDDNETLCWRDFTYITEPTGKQWLTIPDNIFKKYIDEIK